MFGGYLVAGTWTLLAIAAMLSSAAAQRNGRRRGPARLPCATRSHPPAVALAGALSSPRSCVARPHQVVELRAPHHAFVIGAVAIAVLALALATGLMLVIRVSVATRLPQRLRAAIGSAREDEQQVAESRLR